MVSGSRRGRPPLGAGKASELMLHLVRRLSILGVFEQCVDRVADQCGIKVH